MRKFDERYSLVRILHAVPEADAVDVYLNGKPMFRNINFTEFTPYVYVPQGIYTMEVYASNENLKPIIEKELEFEAGELSTLAVIGVPESVEILPIEEETELTLDGKSKVRFIHLVPNGRAVDLLLDGEEIVTEIRYKDITEYIDVDEGIYEAEVELSQNGKLIRQLRLRINSDRIYSFYALGNKPNFQVFQSLDGSTFLK